jgi:hypothetical protein
MEHSFQKRSVIPAKAGISVSGATEIPAFAGMTLWDGEERS